MNDPYFDRPQIWDKVLQKQRVMVWHELSDDQRMRELEYANEMNWQILREIQHGKRSTMGAKRKDRGDRKAHQCPTCGA